MADASLSETTGSQVALVTGSSRGLGAVIAQRLARDGFAVAVNSTDPDGTRAVAAEIQQRGGRAHAFVADITDPDQVADLVVSIESELGPIDAVVFNATGPQPEAALVETSWSDYLDQLDFFVKSPVLLAAQIVPGMIARNYGRIINIDSEVAHAPPPGRSAYATAKNAQVGLTKAWARELAPHGITVNTVAPGFIPVERHAGLTDDIASYTRTVPAGHIGTPADIAHAVAFFASRDAGFVTGQRIIVDGGKSVAG